MASIVRSESRIILRLKQNQKPLLDYSHLTTVYSFYFSFS